MGLDAYLVAARNKKQLESEEFWDALFDSREMKENYEWDTPAELAYWRKFWDLHTAMSHKYGLDNGDWVELNKDDLEYMLDVAAHNPDYWDDFKSVPDICRVIYNYDKLRENGLQVFYGGNY